MNLKSAEEKVLAAALDWERRYSEEKVVSDSYRTARMNLARAVRSYRKIKERETAAT